jgi:hypothetical protein
MLTWNIGEIKALTGTEIWLFIVARVLVGFGAGVLGVRYFPDVVSPLGLPALVVAVLLFLVAAKGFWRTTPKQCDGEFFFPPQG